MDGIAVEEVIVVNDDNTHDHGGSDLGQMDEQISDETDATGSMPEGEPLDIDKAREAFDEENDDNGIHEVTSDNI